MGLDIVKFFLHFDEIKYYIIIHFAIDIYLKGVKILIVKQNKQLKQNIMTLTTINKEIETMVVHYGFRQVIEAVEKACEKSINQMKADEPDLAAMVALDRTLEVAAYLSKEIEKIK